MPVFNEGKVISQTIDDVQKVFPFIVAIDDGSSDNSAAEIAKSKAILVKHPMNMGQGAALQTGIDYALQFPDVEYFVTFDADGQHSLADVKKMHKIIRQGEHDILMGSRFLGSAINMPRLKKVLFRAAIVFTNVFSGVRLTDTHNGLRVFNRAFAEKLKIKMPGMAHASEIIDKVGRGKWRYKEVPVTINYTEYSMNKGQSTLNSVNVVLDLLFSRVEK